jgi:hypothetical protein
VPELKVAELRKELEQRSLPISGNKYRQELFLNIFDSHIK